MVTTIVILSSMSMRRPCPRYSPYPDCVRLVPSPPHVQPPPPLSSPPPQGQLFELRADIVYGGDIQSIDTDH